MWIMVHPLGVCFGFLLCLLAWCLGIVGDDGDVLAVRGDLVTRDVDRNLTGIRGGLLQITRRVTRFSALVLRRQSVGKLGLVDDWLDLQLERLCFAALHRELIEGNILAAFRQKQDALSIRHPFAIVLAAFIHIW